MSPRLPSSGRVPNTILGSSRAPPGATRPSKCGQPDPDHRGSPRKIRCHRAISRDSLRHPRPSTITLITIEAGGWPGMEGGGFERLYVTAPEGGPCVVRLQHHYASPDRQVRTRSPGPIPAACSPRRRCKIPILIPARPAPSGGLRSPRRGEPRLSAPFPPTWPRLQVPRRSKPPYLRPSTPLLAMKDGPFPPRSDEDEVHPPLYQAIRKGILKKVMYEDGLSRPNQSYCGAPDLRPPWASKSELDRQVFLRYGGTIDRGCGHSRIRRARP